MFKRSVISNSPLFEGFNFFAYLTTSLSKKYRPVIAKSDKNLVGFSLIETIFFELLTLVTP